MSQHDYDITTTDANTGAAMRAAINAALQALATCSSGSTAPATTYPYMLWADTTNGVLKQRNAANSEWVNILTLASGVAIGADMLDGFHASQTPAANQIPVLDGDGNYKHGSMIIIGNVGTQWRVFGGSDRDNIVYGLGAITIANNASFDGVNWHYIVTGPATKTVLSTAAFTTSSAPSGGAGGIITWSQDFNVWHAGNDGPGSGLDADMLDGQQGSYYQPASDERLKQDVAPLDNALTIIQGLNPVRFAWNDVAIVAGAARTTHGNGEVGLLAQEVAQVLPDAVLDWLKTPYLTIDYRPIVATLVGAVKDLAARVEALERP